MNTKYELYGGPLDGLVIDATDTVAEGMELSMDLVSQQTFDDLTISRPAGVAVFTMTNGRFIFTRQEVASTLQGN